MTTTDHGTSFYFFDFDDNIMFLGTKVRVRNRIDGSIKEVFTHTFAEIRNSLGSPGEWADYEQFSDTYSNFGDRDPGSLQPGEEQSLVADVREAIGSGGTAWQAPSWPLLQYACAKQRPTAIVTARSHSADTIKAAIRVLVEAKLLEAEPLYLGIYAVNNAAMKTDLVTGLPTAAKARFDAGKDVTSDLKRVAINRFVDQAAQDFGRDKPHRFGMSDDDPMNVDLIVKAMCDCKKRYLHMRFFVIDTHKDEHVKLEVFPADYPVVGKPFPGVYRAGE
ncbi:hypothetical protein [Blastomonas sp.]|uniref:hypothetical protein n=1 Tax=Blastomonas sp. TaxID=1909299 RepID=UPI0035939319